jgi:hypothetical protein
MQPKEVAIVGQVHAGAAGHCQAAPPPSITGLPELAVPSLCVCIVRKKKNGEKYMLQEYV